MKKLKVIFKILLPTSILALACAAELFGASTRCENFYTAGEAAAHALAKKIPQDKGVIALRTRIDAYASESAEEGFLQTWLAHYEKAHPLLLSDYHSGNTPDSAERIARGLFERNKEKLGGVFCASENALAGVLRARDKLALSFPVSVVFEDGKNAENFSKKTDTIVHFFYTDTPAPQETGTAFLQYELPLPSTPYTPADKDTIIRPSRWNLSTSAVAHSRWTRTAFSKPCSALITSGASPSRRRSGRR